MLDTRHSLHRIARGWLRRAASRQAGIIQAPPALVDAVSEWVTSTVAITTQKQLEQTQQQEKAKVQDRRNSSLHDIIKKVKTGLKDKLGVKALWTLVDPAKPNTFGKEVILQTGILGFNMFGRGYTFTAFAQDFKEGSPNLLKKINLVEAYLDGKDPDTEAQEYEGKKTLQRLEQFIFPSAKASPMQSSAEREFDLSKYTEGWRYADIAFNSKYLAESQTHQLEKLLRQSQALALTMKQKLQGMTPEQRKGLDPILTSLNDSVEEHKAHIQDLKKGAKPSFTEIKVVLTLAQERSPKASWHPHKRLVTIFFPKSQDNWSLNDLRESIRHELQHMVQTLLQESLLVDTAGLPPIETLTPQYKQWLGQTNQSQYALEQAMADLDGQGVVRVDIGDGRTLKRKPQEFDFHALDDTEFFTRLQDSIQRFKKTLSLTPLEPKVKNNAIDLFTGKIPFPASHDSDWHAQITDLGGYENLRDFQIDPFFKELRRVPKARAKYDRAIKELRKALGYSGQVR